MATRFRMNPTESVLFFVLFLVISLPIRTTEAQTINGSDTDFFIPDTASDPVESLVQTDTMPVTNPNYNSLDEVTQVRIRSPRAKYSPTYRWLGIGKRDPDGRPIKYGNQYRWVGLGKRFGPQKYGPQYRLIGLGKRAEPRFNPGYKWIGLGKRSPLGTSDPTAQSIQKRMPFLTSNLLNGLFNDERLYRDAGQSNDLDLQAYFAGATAKYLSEEAPMDSLDEPSPFSGNRPSVRGGFEPIYRYVGLG